MTAGAAGTGGQDDSHERPPWLVEDDPEAIRFAGVAPCTDPVIGGGTG